MDNWGKNGRVGVFDREDQASKDRWRNEGYVRWYLLDGLEDEPIDLAVKSFTNI